MKVRGKFCWLELLVFRESFHEIVLQKTVIFATKYAGKKREK